MKQISESNDPSGLKTFYLPHHCVFKDTSLTTKLRVVFDGSAKSESGVSLNDVMLVGPVIQQDLFSLLIRFRTFLYIFTADIVKMYRQVLVQSSQTSLQRILWRNNVQDPIGVYELQTVTYGTAPASYLSTRCLRYLADDYQDRFPTGADAVANDFYMDDLLTGANTIQEAEMKRDEIISILESAKFTLDKWCANDDKMLEDLALRSDAPHHVLLNKDSDSRILGLQWNPHQDIFRFDCKLSKERVPITKRTILSEISQLFDPLGSIGPILVIAKLMIQELWQLKIDWDSSVPSGIHTRWIEFRNKLPEINNLRVPRLTIQGDNISKIELHGFSDTSQSAYGACFYIRTKDSADVYRTCLVSSKSRVSPLKAVSLPRLELCAALLLAQLYPKIVKAINIPGMRPYFWSDSSITLAWIKSPSRKWSTFVSNRVGEIQRLTDTNDWRHVDSKFNPADIISRGANPTDLQHSPLWWNGPEWLQFDESMWLITHVSVSNEGIPEAVKTVLLTTVEDNSFINELICGYSNLRRLIRVFAYCLRFINNVKSKSNRKTTDSLEFEEEQSALKRLCKFVQKMYFYDEIVHLRKSSPLKPNSKILSLSPFLDIDGLLRVGGRLKDSSLPYTVKHQILLPKDHHLTILIIRYEHIRGLHGGVQTTIYAVRRQFWPISIKPVARKIIHQCITCYRVNPTNSQVTTANLPSTRIEPSRPFTHCGIDYGGQFTIREGKRRNARLSKCWIAVFVCFATKAIHIELVNDLSSEAFIGALKRFIARREKPSCIYTDNGTNFTGASREIKELYEAFIEEQSRLKLNDFFTDSCISFQNIPPHAPHFGGLWESAIKSAKFHMKHVIGNASMNYDEMTTILTEIESILNSRPISAISNDPNDLLPLTPAHFLIGDTFNSFPYPNVMPIESNKLSRWQRVEQLRQHFWQRWSHEYLNFVQPRTKWKQNKGELLKVDQLVLINQPNLAPLQWLLGRVTKINTGTDDIARSAEIKTKNGILTRPLVKLSILPLN